MIAALIAQTKSDHTFLCEVGLGGRLDCANALDTQLAILTHISYDHCHVLGNTLEEIATEKLAIARPQSPLLIAPQSSEAETAVRSSLPKQPKAQWVKPLLGHTIGMPGDHQQGNAGTAIAAAKHLLSGAFDESKAAQAVGHAALPGRCQLVKSAQRTIMVDGAHNEASVAATLTCADKELGKYIIILGVAKDKDIAALVRAIPEEAQVIRCRYDHNRSRGSDDWPDLFSSQHPFANNLEEALQRVPTNTNICITGSLYLAGEALALLSI